MTSSVVALQTALARPCPAILCRAARILNKKETQPNVRYSYNQQETKVVKTVDVANPDQDGDVKTAL
jgi:hypothetical protein